MPITVGVEIRRLDEHEFGEVVFETMRQIFSVHDEFGRFFDEKIYERELAFRIAGAQTEVPIDVTFDGFCKRYFVDLLVAGGAIFELKSVGGLYEEAATHFCGRNAEPLSEIEIHAGNRSLGMQKVRLADPLTALKVTASIRTFCRISSVMPAAFWHIHPCGQFNGSTLLAPSYNSRPSSSIRRSACG